MTTQKGRSVLAQNTILNLFGQALPMLTGLLTIPFIVKGLGPDAYGILSLSYMVLGYFGIFDLGLSRATVKFVAEHLDDSKIHKVPELVWTSLALLLAIGSAGAICAALAIPYLVTHVFKMPPSFFGEAKASLLILCGAMPIMLANDALRGVLESVQRFDLVNYVKVPASVLFYLLAALLIPLGVHVPGIVFLLVLVRFVTTFVYLVMSFRAIPSLRTNIRISKAAVRPLARFGGWIMVSNLMAPIGGNIERFIIASVLSVGALTYYSVPFDLVGKILIFPGSLAPTLFPYFSYHGSRSDHVSDVTSRGIKYLLVIMAPITAVFVCFAPEILNLWLGAQFASQSAFVMRVVALVCFLNAFAYIPYSSVQALGRPDLKAILDVVAIPVFVISAWWLMRHFGIGGAALAKLSVTLLDTGCLFVFAWRLKAFSVRDFLSGALSRAWILSACLFVALLFVRSLHARLIPTILMIFVCSACYIAAFWLMAVEPAERSVIKQLPPLLIPKRRPVA